MRAGARAASRSFVDPPFANYSYLRISMSVWRPVPSNKQSISNTTNVGRKRRLPACKKPRCEVFNEMQLLTLQVGQLSQTNRAAAWVSFGKNVSEKSVHLTSLC